MANLDDVRRKLAYAARTLAHLKSDYLQSLKDEAWHIANTPVPEAMEHTGRRAISWSMLRRLLDWTLLQNRITGHASV